MPTAAFAQGTAFTYQGQLKNGEAPVNASVNMEFRLFDAVAVGNQVGATLIFDGAGGNPAPVTVVGGLFTVQLDFGGNAYNGDTRWLEVTVGGTPLSPRQALTATPYALFSAKPWITSGSSISYLGGNVGIGTAPSSTLDVAGTVRMTGLSLTSGGGAGKVLTSDASGNGTWQTPAGGGGLTLPYSGSVNSSAVPALAVTNSNTFGVGLSGTGYTGVFGTTSGVNGVALYGIATGGQAANSIGAFGATESTIGYGVFGLANNPTGANRGVYGRSDSGTGSGVYGLATATSGFNYGGYFSSNSTSGSGVFCLVNATTGLNQGGYFETTSSEGRGIAAFASATSGQNYGGQFLTASTQGYGVYAHAPASSGTTYGVYAASGSTGGTAVYGRAYAASGITHGVYGESNSSDGRGVYGLASATSGTTYGGRFANLSTDGRGVFADTLASTGTTYGVYGASNSTSGTGVYGKAYSTTGGTYGVQGETTSTGGIGVLGFATASSGTNFGMYGACYSTAGRGVVGEAYASSGATYGVWGLTHSAAGFGVFSNGPIGATGTKSFRIDHPDDPENKYLLHYSPESPEVINFYRGNVVLDGAGEAVVALPRYFAKINKNPSYQLTAVGVPMPTLHVAEEIDEAALSAGAIAAASEAGPVCSFHIAGGAPGGKVSWRVEAQRNDFWCQQHPAAAEVEKQGSEKGTYQQPELYGQPAEKGHFYRTKAPEPIVSRDASPQVQ